MEHLILPLAFSDRLFKNAGDENDPADAACLLRSVNTDSDLGRGHSDWRLPALDEVRQLHEAGVLAIKGTYWSATKRFGGFNTCSDVGYVGIFLPKTYLRVMPVRG